MKRCLALASFLLFLVACAAPRDARTVTLVADGETREITTEAFTVRDLLERADIALDAEDRVSPAELTLIESGMTIRVTRVETRTETEQREIPYDRRTVHDASIPVGESQLLEPGITGIEELTFRVTLEDGVEVDRRLVRQETLREARTEVIMVGAQTERQSVSITGTVAYVANHNAWLIQQTSLNQRRLTYGGDLDGRVFDLSADGTHLLFSRVPTETEESTPLNTLWVLDTSTANAAPVQLEVNGVLWAAWEPSCDVSYAESACRIAFTSGSTAEGNPGWEADNDLWTARPRPSTGELFARRQVLEPTAGGSYGWWGTTYAWSPDGQNLAYARADEVGIIRVYDGQSRILSTFPPYRLYAPWVWTPTVDWSPEGKYIVTTLHGPGPTGETPEDSPVFDVWALSADGTITAELASEVGMWSAPAFAPQTDFIAFGRARSPYASHTSSYDLHVMDRDGSDRRLVFPGDEEIGLAYPEIAWSPNGERVMAVYQENLYLVDVPGGEARRLTDGGGVMTVTWQPGSWEVSDQSIDFSEESNLQGHQDWQEDIKSDPRRD
jgi:WD40 repeat protein